MMKLRPFLLPALLALVAFGVFANSLGGGFVYDDARQIVRNPLIQDSALYGKALASDVWAFKGDGTAAASNYYRPTFVVWLIAMFKLFGAAPFGWHLAGVLLHAAACVLAFLLLRRVGFSEAASFGAAVIFAVHPVHVESVAWISGAPDTLFAAALFGALVCFMRGRERESWPMIAAAVALYAVALGAKEVAMLAFPLFPLAEYAAGGDVAAGRRIMAALPFAAAAAAFFAVRLIVLGAVVVPVEDQTKPGAVVWTLPSLAVFYLRQIFFPSELSVNYPLRPTPAFHLGSIVLPLVLVVAFSAAAYAFVRTERRYAFAAALFALPLMPALNAASFPFDQIVHDRYLYVPLLGAAALAIAVAERLAAKFVAEKHAAATFAAAAVLAAPLAYRTVAYNPVWASNLALWTHAATVDPNSATTQTNLGSELSALGRPSEAAEAYTRSLAVRPTATAYVGRAQNLVALKRPAEAERDARAVIAMRPEDANSYALYQAYEVLALALTQASRQDEAAAELAAARAKLPMYRAALTEKLAVVLYQKGAKEDALRELEGARGAARTEFLPESKCVMLRLGMLYAERGRRDDAKAALAEYLKATENLADKVTQRDRPTAIRLFNEWK